MHEVFVCTSRAQRILHSAVASKSAEGKPEIGDAEQNPLRILLWRTPKHIPGSLLDGLGHGSASKPGRHCTFRLEASLACS